MVNRPVQKAILEDDGRRYLRNAGHGFRVRHCRVVACSRSGRVPVDDGDGREGGMRVRMDVGRDGVIQRGRGRISGHQLEAAGTTLGAATVGYTRSRWSRTLLVRQEVGRARG